MRIAVVGNGRTVHALVRGAALAARGHQVRLVTAGEVLDAPGIEVRTRPLPGNPFAAVLSARGFLRDIHSFRPDVLHVHYAGNKLSTMALVSGVHPLVVTVMGGDVQPEQHLAGLARLERRATRRLLEEADLILAKSDALRPEIASFGRFESKIETVRWGVDPELFQPRPQEAEALRARLGLQAGDLVVFSPRLMRPLYNIHLLLEAFPLVLARVPRAVLLLTEHRALPEYRRSLAARAAELGIEGRVRFVGRIEHRDMPAYYSLAAVSVNLPFSDGLPQSLFEAMACGTPSLLGRLPWYAEVVTDGEHVVLCDLEPPPIGLALAALLADAPLRQSLGEAGRRRVMDVACLPREAERVERFYERLLASPRRRPSWAPRILDGLTLALR
jgi:glycosyltransferase involved in cell wall biosynthesis